MRAVFLFSLMALLSKKTKKQKNWAALCQFPSLLMTYYCPTKFIKIYIIWSEIHTIRLTPLSHTQESKPLSLESFHWVHIPWEDPGTSWNFCVSKWSQLDLSSKLIFILGEEKSLTQRLWDLRHICFTVQEQVPRKPKTAGIQRQGLIHNRGAYPRGLGRPGLLRGSFTNNELHLFYNFPMNLSANTK